MIATCPACDKRYRVPDEAVPPEGRSVRCTACGHGWIAYRDGTAPPVATPGPAAPGPALANPALHPAAAERPIVAAAAPVPTSIAPVVSAPETVFAPTAANAAAFRPVRRFRWGCLTTAVVGLAVAGAVAVVEFAPVNTFNPPRLGLPPVTLRISDLGAVSLPKFTLPRLHVPSIELPPLDLTRIPYVGASLDRLVNPPPVPASPLRLTATGERHRLANGHTLLNVTGTLANPTALPQAVPAIDAALLDPAGHAAFHWRIAPPVVELAPHQSVAIESVAANYPPDATVLRLRLKGR